MTITVVFDPPLPSDSPTVFNTKAFALVGDLNTFATQVNAAIATMNTSIADTVHAATLKATPIGADEFALIDTAAANTLKRLTWTQLLATAKTYFDTVYATGTGAAIRSLLGITTLSGSNTGDQTTITGNAGSATVLATPRNINGVAFDGSTNITVAAAAGTLTGATLAAGVTASSLTSVGTLGSVAVTGAATVGQVVVNSATIPANGLYLSAANTVAIATNSAYQFGISADGHIGIGANPQAGVNVYMSKGLTTANAYGLYNLASIDATVTSIAGGFVSAMALPTSSNPAAIRHMYALQASTYTGLAASQAGFVADASLIGATNNYGFNGNIGAPVAGVQTAATITAMSSSGTTVTVTAANTYTNGQSVTIAATANASALTSGCPVVILTMGTTTVGQWQAIGAVSGTIGEAFFATGPAAGTGTVTLTQQGSGKTVASATGTNFTVQSASATYASVTLLTGTVTVSLRYNLYMGGTADNYLNGRLGLGISPTMATGIYHYRGATTGAGANYYGMNQTILASPETNGALYGNITSLGLASAYSMTTIYGFIATQASFSGGTVTSQIGFYADATLSGATNNYGFYSAVPAAANAWGFYQLASATANNSFSGVTYGLNGFVTNGPATSGYGAGSGGTATQSTSRTTGVTINKPSGAITMFTAAGSVTAASFTVSNSLITANDTINLAVKSSTNKYLMFVTAVAAGSFEITFFTTGGVTSDTPVINFAVIKGAVA